MDGYSDWVGLGVDVDFQSWMGLLSGMLVGLLRGLLGLQLGMCFLVVWCVGGCSGWFQEGLQGCFLVSVWGLFTEGL